ncbi:MAG: VCBS repeat-containing protein [Desulfatitalea sp.]
MNRILQHPYFLFVAILVFCFPLSASAAPVKVAVLPFAIHADKDYAFLQKGIVEMLTSRLSAPGKVEVADPIATAAAIAEAKGMSGESLARTVAAKLKADVAIHGSLTVLGDSVSIDAKTLDVTGNRPALTFFRQTQGMGEVIPQINLMAGEINSQMFGVTPTAASAAATVASPAVAAVRPTAPTNPADIHMHPEKLLQSGQPATPESAVANPLVGAAGVAPANPLNPAFTTAQGMQAGSDAGFWKSRNYNHLINGIDVGDVDKDGQQETVVATPQKIFIYRFTQGKQQSVAEIDAGSYTRFISVSIGDINANGTPEIFVTAFTTGLDGLQSAVYEFDGRKFAPIVQNSRYYYTIVRHPALGVILLGQQQNSGGATPFDSPIFQFEWKGAEYVPARPILPARKANVLGLALGDIRNDGGETVACLDEDDSLRVLSPNGKSEWKSEDHYGGTALYFALPPKGPGDSDYRVYLPVRIRTADLDRNGKLEVLVAQNQDSARRLLDQQRFFSKSTIEALVWDGLGLTPAWKTRQLSGRIQDFVVADFDNDGTDELLVAVVTKDGAVIFTDAQSALVAFDLKPAQ